MTQTASFQGFSTVSATGSASGTASVAAATGGIRDVTTATFRQEVMAESMKQPVLVDFWAPWCGPCKQLAPILERAVAAAGGKVKLVKMNVDENPEIPGQLGIQSIPAVIAFSKGQPVDGFVGNVQESQIAAFIARLAGPTVSPLQEAVDEAAALAAAGDVESAAEIYAAVLERDPALVAAIAGLAQARLALGDRDGARDVLAAAPAEAAGPELAAARAALDLADQTAQLGDTAELERRIAADPADHQSRFDLALAEAARGRKLEAVGHLIEIVRRERGWNEEAARKQLLQMFEAWGPMDEASIQGRRRLSAVLFA